MNNLFLRSKHWHLFLLTFAIPTFIYTMSMGIMAKNMLDAIESGTGPSSMDFENIFGSVKIVFMIIIILSSTLWLWYWSLGVGLQKYIPEPLRLNTTLFKVLYFLPVIYVIVILFLVGSFMEQLFNEDFITPAPEAFESFFWIFIPLNFIVVFASFYVLYFAAKSVKTAQLKKKVKLGDFIGEFFLLWIYPIGVWIVQPEVNKVVDNYTLENFDDEEIIS